MSIIIQHSKEPRILLGNSIITTDKHTIGILEIHTLKESGFSIGDTIPRDNTSKPILQLSFDRIESIDVYIRNLKQLKKAMIKGHFKKK